MKKLRPILVIAIALLITLSLLSFKNEDTQTEYCLITTTYGNVIVVEDSGPINENFPKGITKEHFLVQILNKKSKEGWKIINFSGLNSTTSTREFLLVREKVSTK